MEDLTIIIPSRKERFLDNTIHEIFNKAKTKVKIIVTLDGYTTEPIDGVTYIHNEVPKGMRSAINQAVELADTKYIMKLDAHCMLDEGFDVKLMEAHKDNWVQIPTRKRFDAHKWELTHDKPDVNYMYLNEDFIGIASRNQGLDEMIHPTETFQGSGYFMTKEYFNKLGLLDEEEFGIFKHEAQEIGFKVHKDGGQIIRNRNTWYAHPRLGRRHRLEEYDLNIKQLAEKYEYKRWS